MKLFDVARAKGLKRMEEEVIISNSTMLRLVTSLGFSIFSNPEDTSVKRVSKPL